jgi:hypothetical protein
MIALPALFFVNFVLGQTVPLPAKGDNGQLGGIFGITGGLPKSGAPNPGITAKGSEFSLSKKRIRDFGSGPYKAKHFADATIPGQTVYAPKSPVSGVKLPVMVWGNGGCTNSGTLFYDVLVEIASYGYLIVANGPPVPGIPEEGEIELDPMLDPYDAKFGKSKVQQMTDSVDWVVKGGGAKYGDIDTTKIVAAGQSCGGLEAYSASYHDPRIKLTLVINSGVLSEAQKYLLKELTAPVGYFLGGPKDAGYLNVSNDMPLENLDDMLIKRTG